VASRAETRAVPSGVQIELAHGDQRAVVVEVGAGLRAYSAGGRELLDGYPVDGHIGSGRGQVLIPWPNRVDEGGYEFDGRMHQLPLDELPARNAIHGLVRWAGWHVRARDESRVVLEHVLRPRPGYPFTLELELEYALSDAGLSVSATATNAGPDPCPYGCGFHPYLTLGAPSVDTIVLTVPGRTVLRSNDRGIPTSRSPVAGTEYDFTEPRPIGVTRLDNCFTDLERADGVARVELRSPDDGRGATLWLDDTFGYVMVFTGDPLPDVARRSLAVEPMTCPPNAFRSGEALIRLEPGRSVTSTWGITPAPAT
jgi:aldose 1-epimerase